MLPEESSYVLFMSDFHKPNENISLTGQVKTFLCPTESRDILAIPYQLNRLALHRRSENIVHRKQENATENSQNSPQEQYFNCFIEVIISSVPSQNNPEK